MEGRSSFAMERTKPYVTISGTSQMNMGPYYAQDIYRRPYLLPNVSHSIHVARPQLRAAHQHALSFSDSYRFCRSHFRLF